MDRAPKRANVAPEPPSFIPPAPEPTWTAYIEDPVQFGPDDEIDEEFTHPQLSFKGELDPLAVQNWVDEVERLQAQGAISKDELLAYERDWVAKHHLDTARVPGLWDEEGGAPDFRRRWISRAFIQWQRAPEGGHNTPTGLQRSRQSVLSVRNKDMPWISKEYQLRQFRVPEYIPREDEWLRNERRAVGGPARQYNPDQRNMHIYYPPRNPFVVHEGRSVEQPRPGIVNRHVDEGANERKLI